MALAAVGVRGVIVGKVCVRVRAPGPCRLIYMCACLVCNMKKKSGHISSKFPGNKAGFREKYFPEKSPFFKEILRDAKLARAEADEHCVVSLSERFWSNLVCARLGGALNLVAEIWVCDI